MNAAQLKPGSAADSPRDAAVRPTPANDAKTFGRNFVSSAAAQFVSQLLAFILSIYLARHLPVSEYGIFAFGFAFPGWFLRLVAFGLDEVMSIDIAADRSKAGGYMTLVALLRLGLAAVAMLALWGATQIVLVDPFARTITMVLGAASVLDAYASTFTSVFRAFEKLEYIALVTIVERAVAVGTALLLFILGYGLFEISLAFLGASIATLALSGVIAKRRFTSFSRDVDRATLKNVVRKAVPFGIYNAVWTFTFSAGVVLLTVLRDSAATGLFNAAFTLLIAMFSFLVIVNYTILPTMSRLHSESPDRLAAPLRRIQKLSLIGGVPLALGGWFYADAIITTFYGDAFLESAEIFRILILSFTIQTAVMAYEPALAVIGQMKQNLYIGVAGALATVALSVLLILPFGPMGAAGAFLAAQVLIAVLGARAARRYVAPLRAWGTMLRTGVAGLAMLVVLFAIPGLPLWAGVPIGGGVYFATLLGIRGASREDGRVVREGIRGALFR